MSNTMMNTVTNESETVRTISYARFCSIMMHSDTSWNCLKEVFGSDFQFKVLSGTATDAELYDACKLMGTDFRYVLMIRDDYEFLESDPVRDPRKFPVQVVPAAAPAVKIVAAKAAKKQDAVKIKLCRDREHNLVHLDRVNERLKKVGLPSKTVCEFLGTQYWSLDYLLAQKTLKKGTTNNIAWLLRTTPAYLTGQTDDPSENADRVVRRVMSKQSFLLESNYIARHNYLLKKAYHWDDTMIKWLSASDRLVSQDFAKRIAKALGVPLMLIKSIKRSYKTETSLVKFSRRNKKTKAHVSTVSCNGSSAELMAAIDAMSDSELCALSAHIEALRKARKINTSLKKKGKRKIA